MKDGNKSIFRTHSLWYNENRSTKMPSRSAHSIWNKLRSIWIFLHLFWWS